MLNLMAIVYIGKNITYNWWMQLIDVLIDLGHNMIYVNYTDQKV